MERTQALPQNWDHNWQKFFAWSGLIFVVLCGLGLEVFMPQPIPPDTTPTTGWVS